MTTASSTRADDTGSRSGPLPLPPELLAEASNRLGWAGVVYAATYTLAYFGRLAAPWRGGSIVGVSVTQNVVASLSVLLGLTVFILSRRSALAPQQLLDLGLIFEVVGSLGISV